MYTLNYHAPNNISRSLTGFTESSPRVTSCTSGQSMPALRESNFTSVPVSRSTPIEVKWKEVRPVK